MSQPVPPDDQDLLLRLGRLARSADPAPPELVELGKAALTMRRLAAELAELVADSDAALAGVRSTGGAVRLLTFESGELIVEAQVSGRGDELDVLGQVVPEPSAAGGVVRLQTGRGASATVQLDELGGFRFGEVPPGSVRLTVELPGARAVTTAWVSL